MAKVVEEVIVIKFSKLVKDDDKTHELIITESMSALEQVAQELVGNGIIVEAIKE